MLTVDRLRWAERHGPGDYTARVLVSMGKLQHRLWLRVTRDRSRGQARMWEAAATVPKRWQGLAPAQAMIGYGRNREAAVHAALEQVTL